MRNNLEKPDSQKTEGELIDNFFSDIDDGSYVRPGSGAGQKTYDPSLGLGTSQYDENLAPETTLELDTLDDFFNDLESYRASQQPVIDELGNFAVRLTNVIPEAIGGIAAVLDFEDYVNSNGEVGNGITRLMQNWKETTNEEFPIYQDDRGEAFNMTDSAWWIENGSNVVNSVLGFAATGGAITKGLQGLSKLSKLSKIKNLSKALNSNVTQTGLTALGLNQAEAILEATEVYDQTYQYQLQKLANQYEGEELDQKAKEIAADAAETTINYNRLNIFLNLSSANLFTKSPVLTRNILKRPVSIKNPSRMALEGLQESAEEIVNYVSSQKGLSSGRQEEYSMQNLIKDISSDEALESAFFGFLGGVGQTIITTEGVNRLMKTYDPETGKRMSVKQYNNNVYERQKEVLESYDQEKFNDIVSNFKNQIKLQSELQKAIEKEDDIKAKNIQELILSNQAYTAFKNGTTEVFEQYLKDSKKKESEIASEKEKNKIIDKMLEKIPQLESLYVNSLNFENSKEIYNNRATALSFEDKIDDLSEKRADIKLKLDKKLKRLEITSDQEFDVEKLVEGKYPKEILNDPLYKEYKSNYKQIKKLSEDVIKINEEFLNIASREYQEKLIEKKNQEKENFDIERAKKEIELEKEAQKMDEFYTNLLDKGFPIIKNEEGGIQAIGKTGEGAFFKDSKGNVYKVNKDPNSEGLLFTNLETSESGKLGPKEISKFNLTDSNNILTEDQYNSWKKYNKVYKKNKERLDSLNQLISDHNATKERFVRETTLLIERLASYNNDLNFWKNTKGFNAADLSKEISSLENKRKEVIEKIDILNAKRKSLSDTLKVLNDYRITLEELVADKANMEEFSFNVELKRLEEKLLKGDYDLDQIEISESIEIIDEWIEELTDVSNSIQDTIDDLKEIYNNTISDANSYLNLDDDYKKDWLNLSNKQRDILNQIDVKNSELKDLKSQIDFLKKEFNSLQENKKLLVRYEKLKINLNTLEKRNNIKKDSQVDALISQNQKKDGKNDAIEQDSSKDDREYLSQKSTPYSTITNVFKYDRSTGTMIFNNGIPEYSDNWQQAANWSRVMSKITIGNLLEYNVRLVNNKQLLEIGQTPPVNEDDALYAVLYKNSKPYISKQGIVYTGIAKPETYYNTEFQTDNQEKLKNEYSDWRLDTLSKLDSGEQLYSIIRDISPGYARRDDIKKSPKKVFKNIKKLIVPLGDKIVKSNRGIQNVQKGMVYGDVGNGQYERLLNYSINSLPEKKKIEKVNSILRFMSLAEEIKDNNFRQQFRFEGSKSKIPLVGNDKNTGILDYYINWGKSKNNPKWGIAIYDDNGIKYITFNHNGVTERLPLSVLKDAKGKLRQYGDPEIITLTDFLETKYLNVVRNALGKNLPNGFWLPKGFKKYKNETVITFDKYDSYEDFVLKENLYTEVVEVNESLDELPNFVNQYIIFDKNLKSSPIIKKSSKKVEPKVNESLTLAEKLNKAAKKPNNIEEIKKDDSQEANLIAEKLMKGSKKDNQPVVSEDDFVKLMSEKLLAGSSNYKKDSSKMEDKNVEKDKKVCENKGLRKKSNSSEGLNLDDF